MKRRRLLWQPLIVGAALVALGLTGVAQAHVEVTTNNAPVEGTTGIITMHIEHGCEDAGGTLYDTDRVVTQLPKAFTGVTLPKHRGWTGTVTATSSGTRVQWKTTGAKLGKHTPGKFAIAVAYPAKPGMFGLPTVQYCGSLIRRRSLVRIQDRPSARRHEDRPVTRPTHPPHSVCDHDRPLHRRHHRDRHRRSHGDRHGCAVDVADEAPLRRRAPRRRAVRGTAGSARRADRRLRPVAVHREARRASHGALRPVRARGGRPRLDRRRTR